MKTVTKHSFECAGGTFIGNPIITKKGSFGTEGWMKNRKLCRFVACAENVLSSDTSKRQSFYGSLKFSSSLRRCVNLKSTVWLLHFWSFTVAAYAAVGAAAERKLRQAFFSLQFFSLHESLPFPFYLIQLWAQKVNSSWIHRFDAPYISYFFLSFARAVLYRSSRVLWCPIFRERCTLSSSTRAVLWVLGV